MTLALQENYKKGYGATFCTLTYDDDHLKIAGKAYNNGKMEIMSTLDKDDSQKYMRTMRYNFKKLAEQGKMKGNPEYDYILAGEYGEEGGRPHIHIVIIGVDAEEWAKLSRHTWTKGTQQIETLRGVAGISYITEYFSQAVNRKEADRIKEKYGIQAPYITKSRNAGFETIEKNIDIWAENGLRYNTKGKCIPLPRNIREKIDKTYGYRYQRTTKENQQEKAESKRAGFKNVLDYQKWRNWIKEYNIIQRSREKGNGERSTYALETAQKINYIQGVDEL